MARKKPKSKKAKTVRKAARKSAAKRTKAPARKATKKKTAKRPATKAARKTTKKASRKTTKKTKKPSRPRATKNVAGEGSYTASRNFRKKEESFVRKNKARIPEMGKEAEAALEGPQGAELQAAEAEAAAHGDGME